MHLLRFSCLIIPWQQNYNHGFQLGYHAFGITHSYGRLSFPTQVSFLFSLWSHIINATWFAINWSVSQDNGHRPVQILLRPNHNDLDIILFWTKDDYIMGNITLIYFARKVLKMLTIFHASWDQTRLKYFNVSRFYVSGVNFCIYTSIR